MASLVLALLLAAPGGIRVRVEGDATEVVAFRDGVVAARADVADGQAALAGLDAGAAYDVRARGPKRRSPLARGVRAVAGGDGFDAVLRTEPAFPVTLETEPGAVVYWQGLRLPVDGLHLPAGLHRIVVDHAGRVSSAERILRVAGPVTVAVPLEVGLRIDGRVVDAEEHPVAGARVAAFVDGFATRRRATTDADGRFGLAGLRGEVVSVEVEADGFARGLSRALFYPGEERTRVEVKLRRGAAVTVKVEGAVGAQAEGVLLPAWYEEVLEEPRLRANHVPVRARGTGALRFDHLAPGRAYRVLVRVPGFRPASTAVFEAGATDAVTVRLERGATIAGSVKGGGAGLRVERHGPGGDAVCRTDRAGRFVFAGLDPGEHVLFVKDVDERGTAIAVKPGERKDVVLEPGGERARLAGVVFDADHEPLPGVIVEASGRRAVTGDDGAFALEELPAGRQRFVVTFEPGPGCRGLVADPHLPLVERKVERGADVRVRLARAGRLHVRLDTGGRRLTRARLHIAGTTGVSLVRQVPRGAREVVVDDIPVGRYTVEVAAPGVLGTGDAVVEVVPASKAPAEPTVLTVLPGRSVRGTVVEREEIARGGGPPAIHDRPLDRGWVVLLDGHPRRALAVTPVDADGSFLLEGLPAASVLLCAAAPGLPPAVVEVDLGAGDAADVVLPLQEGVEAAVRVLGDGDVPLEGARVRFLTEHGVDVRDLAALARFRRVVADEGDFAELGPCFRIERAPGARFAAPFLAPGSYRVLVSADGYKTVRVGVRARSKVAQRELRARFRAAGAPLPEDLASPVRLARERAAGD